MKAYRMPLVVALCYVHFGSTLAAGETFASVRVEPLGQPGVSYSEPLRATRLRDLPDARRRLVETVLDDTRTAFLADGAGGGVSGVSGLETLQVLYEDPEFGEPNPEEGSGLLVSWVEDGLQESVQLEIDGFQPIPIRPTDVPDEQLLVLWGFRRCDPAVTPNCVQTVFDECSNDTERENLVRVSVVGSDGTSDSVCQEILRSWPLANRASFCCRPANSDASQCEESIFTTASEAGLGCNRTVDANEAICGIVVTAGNGGPSASRISIFLDDGHPEPAVVLEDSVEIKCFEGLVPVAEERDFEVTVIGLMTREKAAGTTWNDPVSETSFSGLDGSFIGIDPFAFLGRAPTPEVSCSVRSSCRPRFRRGDTNADGGTDLSDGVFALLHLVAGGASAPCEDAMDLDDSGEINLSDAVVLFNLLFRGGAEPPPPFGDVCGTDPTADELGCESDFHSAGLCD